MNKFWFQKGTCFLMLLMFCSSCLRLYPERVAIVGLENVSDINRSLTIARVFQSPEFGSISLAVINNSDRDIWISENTGIKIYLARENGNWEEIDNLTTYCNGEILLVPFSEGGIGALSLAPDIPPNLSEPVIRVVVIGNIGEDDSHKGEPVGAYVDITINR